jgi:NitT/TauT family transport system permease protein
MTMTSRGALGTDPAAPDGTGAPATPPVPPAPVARRRPARAANAGRWALRGLSLVAFVGAWALVTELDIEAGLRFSKLPSPGEVAASLRSMVETGALWPHVGASLRRILVGFGLASVTGVALGLALGRSPVAHDAVNPVLELLRPIPAIAWVPIAILAFPTGEQGVVFITFLAALFPVIVSTRHAVRALPLVWEEAVRTMGGGRATVLWRVVLPGALPGIFSGLSVAMGVAWICVVSAEMISGQHGVGYFTWMSYGLLDYAGVVVGMATIGVLGLLSSTAVERAGRACTRWLPRAEVVR